MKKTVRNAVIWTLITAKLLSSEPAIAQNIQESKQNLIENLEKKQQPIDSSISKILENNKNTICYITNKETKVYSDNEWKQVIWTIPAWTFIRKNNLTTEKGNEQFINCNFRGKEVWIPINNLTEGNNNITRELLKPKTEKAILVDKANRKIQVYGNYGTKLLKEFKTALSPWWEWDKIIEWDWNTPEGKYYICYKNPASAFWTNPKTGKRLWSLQVSYPNLQDAAEGLIAWDITKEQYQSIKSAVSKKGIPNQWTELWNYIMIHWGGNEYDWTAWCMGLSDEDMLWLYNNIWTGTDIFIW